MAPPWLALDLGFWHQMGLAMLLGGFIVAAIDDMKYMGSTRSFGEWWTLLIVAFLAIDGYFNLARDPIGFAAKLLIVVVFAGVSNNRTGLLFALAIGDILAVCAVLALIPWVYGLVYLVFLKILDLVMRPLLRIAGRGDSYPFMPVVVAAALAVLAFAYVIAPNLQL